MSAAESSGESPRAAEPFSLKLNPEGDLEVAAGALPHLRMLLEDLRWEPELCDRILTAIEDVRAGRRARYDLVFNAVGLLVLSGGASFRIAAKLTRNRDIPMSLDELESALRRTRALIAAAAETGHG